MIRCKEKAPDGCKNKGMCCLSCEYKNTCKEACGFIDVMNNQDWEDCVSAYEEENALEVFQNKALAIMQGIADRKHMMDKLEAEDENLRKELTETMQEYGIKSFENEILKITTIAETTKTTVDSKKLKEEAPEIYKKYSKTSPVKASVRIEVKGN